jgi:hypothetical protein
VTTTFIGYKVRPGARDWEPGTPGHGQLTIANYFFPATAS